MYRVYGLKIAPRQLILLYPNKLHPCNDAFSALPNVHGGRMPWLHRGTGTAV